MAASKLRALHSQHGQLCLVSLRTSFPGLRLPPAVRNSSPKSRRLCRLLRDEVLEQMALGSTALAELAVDSRALLFPEASDAESDGYAQAVTFGLLVARARGTRTTRLCSSKRLYGTT